jgi:dCMP deaminase
MEIAEIVAKRSAVETTKVGVVIVKENRVISMGYNGTLSGFPHVRKNNDQSKEVHAEINAICFAAKAGIALNGATMFVTKVPCINCVKAIIQAGINNIIYKNKSSKNKEVNPDGLSLLEECKNLGLQINTQTYED